MNIPSWLTYFGDLNYRGECHAEDYVLSSVISRIRKDYASSYGVVAFHVKNEGKRTTAQYKADSIKGLTKGVSDIVIPGNPALFLEIKRQDHTKSKWQPGQLEFLKTTHDLGACVIVAFGYEAAIEAIQYWVSLQKLN